MRTERKKGRNASRHHSRLVSIRALGRRVAQEIESMPENHAVSGNAAFAFELFNGLDRFKEANGRDMSSQELSAFRLRLARRKVFIVKQSGKTATFILSRNQKTF